MVQVAVVTFSERNGALAIEMTVVVIPPTRLKCLCAEAYYMEPKSNSVSSQEASPTRQSARFFNVDIGSPQLLGSAKEVEAGWDLIAGGRRKVKNEISNSTQRRNHGGKTNPAHPDG